MSEKKRKAETQSRGAEKQQSMLSFVAGSKKKSETIPVAATTEFSQCPYCLKPYPLTSIFDHVDLCRGQPSPPKNVKSLSSESNAFTQLIKSEKANRTPTFIFSLTMVDGKLLPVFMPACEALIDETWSAVVKLNKFRCDLEVSSDNGTKHRPILVKLQTNLPIPTKQNKASSTGINPAADDHAIGGPIVSENAELASRMPSVALLKSMLQKATRRRQTHKVLKIAQTLAAINIQEFLRRLPAICVEDALLHPGMSVLVWLMMAQSKDFPMQQYLVDVCALIAGDLSRSQYRDCHCSNELETMTLLQQSATCSSSVISSGIGSSGGSSSKNVVDLSQDNTSSEHKKDASTAAEFQVTTVRNQSVRTLIASLLMRASFGGMTEDVKMLEDYAVLWNYRLFPSGSDQPVAQMQADKTSGSHMTAYLHCRYIQELGTSTLGYQMIQSFGTTDIQELASGNGFSDMVSNIGAAYSVVANESAPMIRTATTTSSINDIDNSNTTGNIAAGTTTDTDTLARCTQLHPVRCRYITSIDDLCAEGVDFISDWGLIPAVIATCNQSADQHTLLTQLCSGAGIGSVDDTLKSCIWLFRSGVNTHKLWSGVSTQASMRYNAWHSVEVSRKQKLSKLWGLICPSITVYWDKKLRNIVKKINNK